MQDGEGKLCSWPVEIDLGFKEMQVAVMAELAASLQPERQLPGADSNLIRTAFVRTQVCLPCSCLTADLEKGFLVLQQISLLDLRTQQRKVLAWGYVQYLL